MPHIVILTDQHLQQLDLSPVLPIIDPLLADNSAIVSEVDLRFDIQFNREPSDPRELSEIPEVRLWFIRLDSYYPWIPFILDWEVGELGRYAAMMVPHQFSPTEGIRYNPEALEIFVMQKIFVIAQWLEARGGANMTRLKFMTQMLGYEIDEGLFQLIG